MVFFIVVVYCKNYSQENCFCSENITVSNNNLYVYNTYTIKRPFGCTIVKIHFLEILRDIKKEQEAPFWILTYKEIYQPYYDHVVKKKAIAHQPTVTVAASVIIIQHYC